MLRDLFLPVVLSQAVWGHDTLATCLFRHRFAYIVKKTPDTDRLKTSLFSTDPFAIGADFDIIFQRSPYKVTIFFVNSTLLMTAQQIPHKTVSERSRFDMFLHTNLLNHFTHQYSVQSATCLPILTTYNNCHA